MVAHKTHEKSLGVIQREAIDFARFGPVRASRLQREQLLPLAVEPTTAQADLAEWAAGHRAYVEERLQLHGGILFHGFQLTSPADFERVNFLDLTPTARYLAPQQLTRRTLSGASSDVWTLRESLHQ